MRKILINSKIEAIAEEYTDKLLKVQTINTQDLSTVNLDKIRKKLTDLSLKLVTRKRSKYRKYVENIIKKLPESQANSMILRIDILIILLHSNFVARFQILQISKLR